MDIYKGTKFNLNKEVTGFGIRGKLFLGALLMSASVLMNGCSPISASQSTSEVGRQLTWPQDIGFTDPDLLEFPQVNSADECYGPIEIPDGLDREAIMRSLGTACTLITNFEQERPDIIPAGCLENKIPVKFWNESKGNVVGWFYATENTIYLAHTESVNGMAMNAVHETGHYVRENCVSQGEPSFPKVNIDKPIEVPGGTVLPGEVEYIPSIQNSTEICIQVQSESDVFKKKLPEEEIGKGSIVCTSAGDEYYADGLKILASGLAPDYLDKNEKWILPSNGYLLNILYNQLREQGLELSPKQYTEKMMNINLSWEPYYDFWLMVRDNGVQDPNRSLGDFIAHGMTYMYIDMANPDSMVKYSEVDKVTLNLGLPSEGNPQVFVDAEPGQMVSYVSSNGYSTSPTYRAALCDGVFFPVDSNSIFSQKREQIGSLENPVSVARLCELAEQYSEK